MRKNLPFTWQARSVCIFTVSHLPAIKVICVLKDFLLMRFVLNFLKLDKVALFWR